MSARRPLVIGHRGARGLAPENSMPGFLRAIELGVDGVEFDVHGTADGGVAVIHDPSLRRTTTGRGPVGARSAAGLAALALRDGGAIPMLGDVLAVLAPTGLLVNVEIKNGPRDARYPGIEAAVAAMLAEHGMMARAVISSFDWTCVSDFLAVARPRLALGLADRKDVRKMGGLGAALQRAAARGFDGLCTTAAVLEGPRPDAPGVLWTYCADNARTIRRALDAGVDALISDRPDLALGMREGG